MPMALSSWWTDFIRWIKRNLSHALLLRGRLEQAVRLLEPLVAADLSDTKARRLLAWALIRLRRHEEAVVHYPI